MSMLVLVVAQSTQREDAKQSFDEALEHYQLGEYRLALEHFQDAYRAEPSAELLFDMGQCYRNLGEDELALDYFERYVRAARPEIPVTERWWFWTALLGAAATLGGSVVLIASLTDRDDDTQMPKIIWEPTGITRSR
jgi:tetratricopeptide (TPR) repeat protein